MKHPDKRPLSEKLNVLHNKTLDDQEVLERIAEEKKLCPHGFIRIPNTPLWDCGQCLANEEEKAIAKIIDTNIDFWQEQKHEHKV